MKKCLFSVLFASLFFLISPVLISNTLVHAAVTTITTSDSTKWNIRIDGPVANGDIPFGTVISGDFDGDGKSDLAIDAGKISLNGVSNSGSVYVIFNSLLKKFSGTGNTLDLANPSDFNIRIDGVTDCFLGDDQGLSVIDIDGNGKSSLGMSCGAASYNSRSSSGSLFILRTALLQKYTGTGNIVDLSNAADFSVRIDGETSSDLFSYYSVNVADITGDGKPDLIIGSFYKSTHGRSNNGSIYIINNTAFSSLTGTGNTLDMANAANYLVRLDGAADDAYLGAVDGYKTVGYGDFDGDGKMDVVFGSNTPNNPLLDGGSLYVVSGKLLQPYMNTTGNTLDMAIAANYNIRFDGPSHDPYSFAIYDPVVVSDINNNGKPDLIYPDFQATNNSIPESGSVYVWFDSFLANYFNSTGNILDATQASNYNLRFNGAFNGTDGSNKQAGGWLGDMTVNTADLENRGKQDLLIGGPIMSWDSGYQEGVIYDVSNEIVNRYTGTGNNIEMADPNNYSRVYYGVPGEHLIGLLALQPPTTDLYGGGSNDLVLSAHRASNNGRSKSGSVYIIYNFPHTITLSGIGTGLTSSVNPNVEVDGTISAPDSTTAVAGVQYSVDDNSPLSGSWTGCSGTTTFSCNVPNLSSQNHTIYVRAYDTLGSYTPQSHYATYNVGNFDVVQSDPNCKTGWKYCINAGPNYSKAISNIQTFVNNSYAASIISNSSNHDDMYVTVKDLTTHDLDTLAIPYPWSQGLNVYSDFFEFKGVSAFNGYPIVTTDHPFTIQLTFDKTKLGSLSPTKLKVSYFDLVTKKWRTLKSPIVVDWTHNILSTTTTTFGTYVLVYPSNVSQGVQTKTLGVKTLNIVSTPTPVSVSIPVQSSKSTVKPKHCLLWWCW